MGAVHPRPTSASISRGIMRSSPGNSETLGGGISQRSSGVIPSEGPIGSKGSAIEGQDFVVRVVHRQGGATSHKGRRSCSAGDFLEDSDGHRVGGRSSQIAPPRGNGDGPAISSSRFWRRVRCIVVKIDCSRRGEGFSSFNRLQATSHDAKPTRQFQACRHDAAMDPRGIGVVAGRPSVGAPGSDEFGRNAP